MVSRGARSERSLRHVESWASGRDNCSLWPQYLQPAGREWRYSPGRRLGNWNSGITPLSSRRHRWNAIWLICRGCIGRCLKISTYGPRTAPFQASVSIGLFFVLMKVHPLASSRFKITGQWVSTFFLSYLDSVIRGMYLKTSTINLFPDAWLPLLMGCRKIPIASKCRWRYYVHLRGATLSSTSESSLLVIMTWYTLIWRERYSTHSQSMQGMAIPFGLKMLGVL